MRFELFYAFDSTTITLFVDVMKGVGRNPKGDGKKKGDLNVHLLTDSDTAKFVTISEAKMHDKKFLSKLSLPSGVWLPWTEHTIFTDNSLNGRPKAYFSLPASCIFSIPIPKMA